MRRERGTSSEPSWGDVRPHLDLALSALPARQREAAVLHYFYGMSPTDIGRQLGCPQTTVSRRLSSALEKLRRKLTAAGLGLSTATLASFLAEKTAVQPPAGLAESISAACLGGAGASAAAAAAADGAVKAIKLAQLKLVSLLVGTAVLVGAGGLVTVGAASRGGGSALKDDPAIIAQLEALRPGHGLRLPAAKVTGLEGLRLSDRLSKIFQAGPGRRNKCNRMAYAPERRSALYCGGGGSALFVTNDAWEFHLGANTWRLVSPPDGGDHREIDLARKRIELGRNVERNRKIIADWHANELEFAGGHLRTRRNHGPVRPSHTWDGLSCDPASGRLYWVLTAGHQPPVKSFFRRTGGKWAEVREGTTLWSLSPEDGRWKREFGGEPRPRTLGMGGALVYDAKRHRLVWYVAARNVLPYDFAMWAYDLDGRTWKELAPNGGADLQKLEKRNLVPGEEIQAAYCPHRDLIVSVGRTKTWRYDCAANEWKPGASSAENAARAADTVFVYDSAARAFLLAQPTKGSLRAYDPGSDRWSPVPIAGSALPGKICAGYYDPRLNVLALYDGSTRVWVYRHKK
jgi:hypothetical protein